MTPRTAALLITATTYFLAAWLAIPLAPIWPDVIHDWAVGYSIAYEGARPLTGWSPTGLTPTGPLLYYVHALAYAMLGGIAFIRPYAPALLCATAMALTLGWIARRSSELKVQATIATAAVLAVFLSPTFLTLVSMGTDISYGMVMILVFASAAMGQPPASRGGLAVEAVALGIAGGASTQVYLGSAPVIAAFGTLFFLDGGRIRRAWWLLPLAALSSVAVWTPRLMIELPLPAPHADVYRFGLWTYEQLMAAGRTLLRPIETRAPYPALQWAAHIGAFAVIAYGAVKSRPRITAASALAVTAMLAMLAMRRIDLNRMHLAPILVTAAIPALVGALDVLPRKFLRLAIPVIVLNLATVALSLSITGPAVALRPQFSHLTLADNEIPLRLLTIGGLSKLADGMPPLDIAPLWMEARYKLPTTGVYRPTGIEPQMWLDGGTAGMLRRIAGQWCPPDPSVNAKPDFSSRGQFYGLPCAVSADILPRAIFLNGGEALLAVWFNPPTRTQPDPPVIFDAGSAEVVRLPDGAFTSATLIRIAQDTTISLRAATRHPAINLWRWAPAR